MDRQLAQTANLPTMNYLLLIRYRYRRNIFQLFNVHLHRCCIIRRNLDVPYSLHFHRATTAPTHKQLAACRSCERRPSLHLHITANESDSWTTDVIATMLEPPHVISIATCVSVRTFSTSCSDMYSGSPKAPPLFLKTVFPSILSISLRQQRPRNLFKRQMASLRLEMHVVTRVSKWE